MRRGEIITYWFGELRALRLWFPCLLVRTSSSNEMCFRRIFLIALESSRNLLCVLDFYCESEFSVGVAEIWLRVPSAQFL